MENEQETLGERRMRLSTSHDENEKSHKIKLLAAAFINYVDSDINAPEDMPKESLGEFVRLKDLALTAIEEAAGWAVKAATV